MNKFDIILFGMYSIIMVLSGILISESIYKVNIAIGLAGAFIFGLSFIVATNLMKQPKSKAEGDKE